MPTISTLKSIADSAIYLGVSTKTVRRYIAEGRLTGYKIGPRLVRLDPAEVATLARPMPNAKSA